MPISNATSLPPNRVGVRNVVQVAWQDGQSLRDPRLVSNVRYLSRDFRDAEKLTDRRSSDPLRSVAAWDDTSPASVAARESLRKAAGIEIPKASFIVWVMEVYLVVLVPLTWGVFRLLGHV